MGRNPTELSQEQMAQVEALAAYLTQEQIADFFGVSRVTFQNMIERDPEISLHYKRGKAKAIGAVAQGLIAKARAGDTASAIFYLKTQAGWRETLVVDSKSSDGTMTPRTIIATMTPQEAAEAYAATLTTDKG
jgi:DNA-binding XRE family transcriptional regulator